MPCSRTMYLENGTSTFSESSANPIAARLPESPGNHWFIPNNLTSQDFQPSLYIVEQGSERSRGAGRC